MQQCLASVICSLCQGQLSIDTCEYPAVDSLLIAVEHHTVAFLLTGCRAAVQGESVFVAAHTSAGKTVVAEYAFALAVRDWPSNISAAATFCNFV